MANWQDIMDTDACAVDFAVQSNCNTPQTTGWVWLDGLMPQITWDPKQTATKRARRSRGAGTKRRTGRVWARISVRVPAVGQALAYAFASNTPTFAGPWSLLQIGTTCNNAYAATGLASASSAKVVSCSAAPKLGSLFASGASGVVTYMNFVATVAGAGPYTVTMFEDGPVVPSNSSQIFATVTMYPSAAAPVYLTIRICGEASTQDYRFVGCVLSKVTYSKDEDDKPWLDYEFVNYAGRDDQTSGALQDWTEYLQFEPAIARGGARTVVASNVFAGLADGTAEADGSCDVRGLTWSIDIPHYVARGGAGCRQGVRHVIPRQPEITCSFTVPKLPDFDVASENVFEKAWRDESEVSVTEYLGDTPGRLLGWKLARGIVTDFPQWVDVEGVWHQRVNLEATHNAADGAATDAGNKVFVIGLG